MKKFLVILIILGTLFTGGFLSYKFFFQKEEKKKIIYTDALEDANIKVEDKVEVEFGKIAYLEDYVSVIDGKLENTELKYSELGENEVKFIYTNDLGKNYRYIKFNVVDTTKPYVSVPSYKTVLVNSDTTFINNFFCADNHDRNVERKLEGNYDLGTVGTYTAKYIASDTSGNSVEKDITLNVVETIPKQSNSSNNTPINYINYSDLYNEHKSSNTKVGIDISRWQGDVDFDQLKENNVEFIMMRLGGQDGIDGEYYLDSKFQRNIEEATKRGFDIGVYFYSYAYTNEEAIKQAKFVLDNLKGYKLTLPIVFDWECWNKFNDMHISLYDITNVQDTFLNYVEKKGYKGARYGSKNYLTNAWQDSKHLTWLAHYVVNTNYDGEYFMWQRCDTGKVQGINGAVDVDILYLDKYHL